jgi:hypothetical protein
MIKNIWQMEGIKKDHCSIEFKHNEETGKNSFRIVIYNDMLGYNFYSEPYYELDKAIQDRDLIVE